MMFSLLAQGQDMTKKFVCILGQFVKRVLTRDVWIPHCPANKLWNAKQVILSSALHTSVKADKQGQMTLSQLGAQVEERWLLQ